MNITNCKKCGHDKFYEAPSGTHLGQYCAKCYSWQKWLPQNNPITIMPFGKYKGELIAEINDLPYLVWLEHNLNATEENKIKFGKLIKAIKERLIK
jgi:uncharacterized protein (DUF3820 family)